MEPEILADELEGPFAQNRGVNCTVVVAGYYILYNNLVETGLSYTHYWVKDWNGDGVADMMTKNSSGQLWFFQGYAQSFNPPYAVPNKTTDVGVWKYDVYPGVQVGNGWNGFIEFHPADWNGDGKCDMMAFNSSTLYVYYFNGSNFYSSSTITPGAGQIWYGSRKRIALDTEGGSNSDTLEVFNIGSTGYARVLRKYNTYFTPTSSMSGFDVNDDYFVHDFSGDGLPDLMIRKSNGNLYYRERISGGTFTAAQQVGNGWNTFTNIYAGNHWNLCDNRPSLTGRKSNGDFITYVWSTDSHSFSQGVQVGNGWDFEYVFPANLLPDMWYRDDFLGLKSDGTLHAYHTLLSVAP